MRDLLLPGEGKAITAEIHELLLGRDDPRLKEICARHDAAMGRPEPDATFVYSSWDTIFRPTVSELKAAEFVQAHPRYQWHGGGGIYDTIYSLLGSCALCHVGTTAISPLLLPIGKLPKWDIVAVLGRELILRREVCLKLKSAQLQGYSLVPVLRGVTEYRNTLVDLGYGEFAKTPRDRLEEMAQTDERVDVRLRAHREALSKAGLDYPSQWYELVPLEQIEVAPETLIINKPCDCVTTPLCPCRAWLGGRQASALTVRAPLAKGADFWKTRQEIHGRGGVWLTAPLYVMSQKASRVLHDHFGKAMQALPVYTAND